VPRVKWIGLVLLSLLFLAGLSACAPSTTDDPGQLSSGYEKNRSADVPPENGTSHSNGNPSHVQGGMTTPSSAEDDVSSPATFTALVTEVIDGDTIKVKAGKNTETVRFLLIDTPETKHPEKPVQPFGPEAYAFTRKLLEGKTVQLELDVSHRDKYGRLLAYVYVDGQSVQEALLEQGLARVAYVFVPNIRYVDRYRAIQDEARKKGIGIWSLEDYAREDGFHPEQVSTHTAGSKSPGQSSTKSSFGGSTANSSSGVVSEKPATLGPYPKPSSGGTSAKTPSTQASSPPGQSSRVPPVSGPELEFDPNGPDRDCSDFASQEAAQAFFEAAGGPQRDPHRLDRDRDGKACEDLP
jgi:micrococcal nuclease